jgi:hypothetical protein
MNAYLTLTPREKFVGTHNADAGPGGLGHPISISWHLPEQKALNASNRSEGL